MNLEFVKTPGARLAITSVLSLAAGSGVTYLVVSKRLEAKYTELAEKEISDAKRFYAQKVVEAEKPSIDELMEKLHADEVPDVNFDIPEEVERALIDYSGGARVLEEPEGVVTENVFTVHKESIDVEVRTNRDESKPFLITEEEWQDGEPGYDQPTISYWSGDGVLTDENDQVIDNYEGVVGTENLQRFGEGTGDENTMYIRNHLLKSDFEVVRSDGHYTHEVLGMRHSDERSHRDRQGSVRKFRDYDE